MNDRNKWWRPGDIFCVPTFPRPRRQLDRNPGFRPGEKNKTWSWSPDEDLRALGKNVSIRKARSVDRAFVISLGKQLFEVYGPYEGAVSRWFDHETTSTFIAERNRVRVGFTMLGTVESPSGSPSFFELLAIGLCNSARRRGIGNRLLETVENYAAHQGLDRIFLHTAVNNYPAQRLFYKRGYRPWGLKHRFYPAGHDAIAMSKEILNPGLS